MRSEVMSGEALAEIRAVCPALDRLCGARHRVWMDSLGITHARDAVCGAEAPGPVVETTTGELFGAHFCRSCIDSLLFAVHRAQRIAEVVEVVHRGPFEPSLEGGARYPRLGAAGFNALTLKGTLREFGQTMAQLDPEIRAELLAFKDENLPRWAAWFETVGAAELREMDRVSGPDAMVLFDRMDPGVTVEGLVTPVPEGDFEYQVFHEFMAACLTGATDPVAVATERALARPELFDDRVVNTDPAEVVRIASAGADLEEVVAAVRDAARRRDVEQVVLRFASRVLPAAGDERMAVVAHLSSWGKLFWFQALTHCFPSTITARGWAILVLPEALAMRSLRALRDGPSDFAHAEPFPENGDVEALFATVAVLLGDDMEPANALGAALGVLAD